MKTDHKRCTECGLTSVGDYKKHQESHMIENDAEQMKKYIRENDRKLLVREYSGLAMQAYIRNRGGETYLFSEVARDALEAAMTLADAVLESEEC